MSTTASKHIQVKSLVRPRLPLRPVMSVFVVALTSTLSYLWLRPADGPPADGPPVAAQGTGGAVLADSRGPLIIEGDAAGPISPGVTAPLDLLLTNPQGLPLSVTDLRVTVRAVSAPNADDAHPCAVGDFTVEQASRSLEITLPARATAALSSLGVSRASLPTVGILERSVNQDGCKGASLTLGYAASGTASK